MNKSLKEQIKELDNEINIIDPSEDNTININNKMLNYDEKREHLIRHFFFDSSKKNQVVVKIKNTLYVFPKLNFIENNFKIDNNLTSEVGIKLYKFIVPDDNLDAGYINEHYYNKIKNLCTENDDNVFIVLQKTNIKILDSNKNNNAFGETFLSYLVIRKATILDNIIDKIKQRSIDKIKQISHSLLPTLISKLAIIALISTISIKIFNNLNNESNNNYIIGAIILCLFILVHEFYKNRNNINKHNILKGGSLELLKNTYDINKFYNNYTKNNLQKIDLSKINIKSYITDINKLIIDSLITPDNKNKLIIKLLSSIDLDDISKKVEIKLINFNQDNLEYKDNKINNLQEEEDINIDENEVYQKYKEITTSLIGKLSNKSEVLLLNKIKDLVRLKQMINNQYDEIIEYTKILSGVSKPKKDMIIDLDNTLSEQKIHNYVTNYKKLIKQENKSKKNFKLILQTL